MLSWLVHKIPTRILAEPERFTLALCFTVIGIDAVFLGAPSSVLGRSDVTALFNLQTGVSFLCGGILTLYGLWARNIWAIRLGAALIVIGCGGLIAGILLYGEEGDGPIALVYGLFAITFALRLLSSSAERIRLHQKEKS
jgi:peptidoglycan/LPS O-acetylase OafA/YrhL